VFKLSSKRKKIPFRVKMADGSIETIYAYSEAQAIFFASKRGKKPVRVVGILSEEVVKEEKKGKEGVEKISMKGDLLSKLLDELNKSLREGRYLDAIKWQVEIHKAIAEGKISWSNELEEKYGIFKYI